MSRLAKNVLYNVTGQGLLLIVSFAAVRLVFRRLGDDALGVIYFALALNILLSTTLTMGVCETIVREVASHLPAKPAYVEDLLRTASSFAWGVYALVSLGIYFAAPVLVEKWIHLKSTDAATAILVLRILGIASFVMLPRLVYTSILRGLERMGWPNLIDVVTTALQQGGIIAILALGGGLLDVVYWIAACAVLGVVAYALVCGRFVRWMSLVPGYSGAVVAHNLSFTGHVAAISVLAIIQMQADKAIVSKLLPIGMFGLYTVASNAVSRSTLLTGAVAQAAFPHLSALHHEGNRERLVTQFNKLQDLICFGTVPLFAAVPFVARPLFTSMFDAHNAQLLLLPATFLAIGFYMNATLTVLYFLSIACGRPDIAARQSVYSIFLVLPSTVALVYFFGLNGAGFSWIFYHLFAYAYQVPRTYAECLQERSWTWYATILKIFGVVAVTYGVAWGVLVLFRLEQAWLPLALAYALATLAFAGIAYGMVGDELRGAFHSQLFAWSERAKGAEVF